MGNKTMYGGDSSSTFTSEKVVNEMLDMLPIDIWNPQSKFLDIYCKTGIFLVETYKRLDSALSKIPEYTDSIKRRRHILNNQLYACAMSDYSQYIISRNVFGDMFHPHCRYIGSSNLDYKTMIRTLSKEEFKKEIEGEFSLMEFDVVLGNPPYNRGGGH